MSKHNKIDQSTALLALTAAAFALPGIAKAAGAPTKAEVSARYSSYSEGDVSGSKTADGQSSSRMSIDVLQARFLMPHSSNQALTIDFALDSMTGASPWYIAEQNNVSKIVMSNATIEDTRIEVYANNKWYLKDQAFSVTGGFSKEDDYFSLSAGGDYETDFNDKHSTLNIGASLSFDTIDPEYVEGSPYRNGVKFLDGAENKNTLSTFFGISQIINKNIIFNNGVGLNFVAGELSDGYKFDDVRPDSRIQFTYSAALRQFDSNWDAVHHYDFRFYNDSWSVQSFTFEYSMYKNLPSWSDSIALALVPNVRYYTQSSADFYYATNQRFEGEYHSSDYRLSAFGALTLGLKLAADYNAFSAHMGLDFYNQKGSLSWYDGVENPALVDYVLFSIGGNFAY